MNIHNPLIQYYQSLQIFLLHVYIPLHGQNQNQKKIRTIQLFLQKLEFTRRDRFLVWGRKKKKKIPKIGKKKKSQGKSSISALVNEAWNEA